MSSIEYLVARLEDTRQSIAFWRVAVALAILLAAFWVYLTMFRGFSPWDDEGLLMFEVRYFLHGHLLYNEIYSQYGPFYFAFQWLYYKAINQPVSHDAARFLAASLWLGCSMLLAWSARLLTGSLVVTGFAFLAVLRTLTAFTHGPGHPEELCLLLVSCLLIASLSVGNIFTARHGAWFGFLAAALTLTKVNIGLYISLALLLVLVKLLPFRRLNKALFWAISVASFAAVIILMSPLFGFGWDRAFCFMTISALIAALLVLSTLSLNVSLEAKAWSRLIGVGLGSGLLVLLPFLAEGTTLPAFLWMTVFQFKDYAHQWYFALPAGRLTCLYSSASLVLAIVWVGSRGMAPLHEKLSFFCQLLKGAVAIFVFVLSGIRGNPFYTSGMAFEILTPLLWMLLLSPETAEADRTVFGRITLCLVSIYTALYAFPVAGAQVSLVVGVMLVANSVFAYDAWQVAQARWHAPSLRFRRVAAACFLLLLGALFLKRDIIARRDYEEFIPLDLPGAKWLHVSPADRDTYHWIVKSVHSRCDTFLSMPGLLSLYFWTAQKPPTLLLAGNWLGLFNDQEQQTVVDSLSHDRKACIVYSPRLVEFWRRGQDLAKSPLANYIKTNFIQISKRNGYHFMVRKSS